MDAMVPIAPTMARRLMDDDFLVAGQCVVGAARLHVAETRDWQQCWSTEIDTFDSAEENSAAELRTGETRTVGPRALVVLRAASSP